jgi:peptidoglycan lytic transglycosylase G
MLAFLRMLFGCFVTAVAIVAGLAGAAYWLYQDVNGPGPLAAAHTTVIPPHTGISEITDLLTGEGVIRHPLSFKITAELTGRGSSLKAGEYELPAHASAMRVLDIIVSGKTVKHRLTVREGLTSTEIVALVRDTPLLTGNIDTIPADGELLPETYVYSRDDTRESVIQRMREAMREAVAAAWAERRPDFPLPTPQDAVVLASIIEKEANRDDERAHIAAVFLNRLRLGMRLQSDPTVIYALSNKGATKLDHPLGHNDLVVESPYNTYVVKGLPSGPICNPGKTALRAAVRPERSDDLYFVADGAGGHVFARTLAEQNRNVAAYLRNAAATDAETATAPTAIAPRAAPVAEARPAAAHANQQCRVSPGHRCPAR